MACSSPLRLARSLLAAALLAIALAACAGDDGLAADDDDDTDGDGCAETEVAVAYLDSEDEREDCEPIPAACGATADCANDECVAALYDLCEPPSTGSGCSDGFPPTIVSCRD
jgi:hypothetical protein